MFQKLAERKAQKLARQELSRRYKSIPPGWHTATAVRLEHGQANKPWTAVVFHLTDIPAGEELPLYQYFTHSISAAQHVAPRLRDLYFAPKGKRGKFAHGLKKEDWWAECRCPEEEEEDEYGDLVSYEGYCQCVTSIPRKYLEEHSGAILGQAYELRVVHRPRGGLTVAEDAHPPRDRAPVTLPTHR